MIITKAFFCFLIAFASAAAGAYAYECCDLGGPPSDPKIRAGEVCEQSYRFTASAVRVVCTDCGEGEGVEPTDTYEPYGFIGFDEFCENTMEEMMQHAKEWQKQRPELVHWAADSGEVPPVSKDEEFTMAKDISFRFSKAAKFHVCSHVLDTEPYGSDNLLASFNVDTFYLIDKLDLGAQPKNLVLGKTPNGYVYLEKAAIVCDCHNHYRVTAPSVRLVCTYCEGTGPNDSKFFQPYGYIGLDWFCEYNSSDRQSTYMEWHEKEPKIVPWAVRRNTVSVTNLEEYVMVKDLVMKSTDGKMKFCGWAMDYDTNPDDPMGQFEIDVLYLAKVLGEWKTPKNITLSKMEDGYVYLKDVTVDCVKK